MRGEQYDTHDVHVNTIQVLTPREMLASYALQYFMICLNFIEYQSMIKGLTSGIRRLVFFNLWLTLNIEKVTTDLQITVLETLILQTIVQSMGELNPT